MSDPKYHDRHTAGIYRAIALRFYCRYVEMRHSAEHEGGDLSAHGRLPTDNRRCARSVFRSMGQAITCPMLVLQ
jgi:hypothetical protein